MRAETTGPSPDEPPPATLVISVWRDLDLGNPLRARIFTGHGIDEDLAMRFATDVEGILSAVREWLSEFDSAALTPPPSNPG